MSIPARYADGRAAVVQPVLCALQRGGIHFVVNDKHELWRFPDLARADDGNGDIILRRIEDTGERLVFGFSATEALKEAAPALFTPRAMGVERPIVPATLAAVAFSLAVAFIIGVPYLAGPIAAALPPQHQAQIGDIAWSQVNAFTDYCDDSDEASYILNGMAYRMMTAANVPQRDDIWITIVDTQLPNAFALPDRSIVVTAGLISLAEDPDELAGVIAHEIAHIERNHVMKNIIRNIGAGIFFDVVFGGAGVGQAIAIASVNLAGLRYSRAYEEEADARGLEFLDAANINSAPLAALFDRLRTAAGEVDGQDAIPALLSSHPPTTRRAEAARARAREGLQPSLTASEWAIVRAACGGRPEPVARQPEQPPQPPSRPPTQINPPSPQTSPPAAERGPVRRGPIGNAPPPAGEPPSTPRARGPGPVTPTGKP